jgi:type VI secretion system secreted protein VgrG
MLLRNDIGRTGIRAVEQPALYLHCEIYLADAHQTVLSDETFRVVEIEGRESVSEPFEYQLTLHANTKPSHVPPLVFGDMLGRRVSFAVALPLPDGVVDRDATAKNPLQRIRLASGGAGALGVALFEGMIASFAMQEPGVYRLIARPALWRLTLANRYRVYKLKNVRDVIREVCSLHGVDVAFRNLEEDIAYNLAISRTQDWLQAGESDYEFVQRLMKKAHLFYYFQNTGRGHTVIFANDAHHPRIAGRPALRYTHTSLEELGLHQIDLIASYSYEQTLAPNGVSGAFTRQEEAWAQDGVATFQTIFKPAGTRTPEPSFNLYKVYGYGVNDQLAAEYATQAAASLRAYASQLRGVSLCPTLRAGYMFQAVEQQGPESRPRPVRPTLDGQWFVVTEVQHTASLSGAYRNEFVAQSADGTLAAVSVQDTHQGTMLARVVDYSEGNAPDDWRYYRKSNFDPERSSARDTGSTPVSTDLQGVYVRFASDPESAEPTWVKLAPHMQSAPEIGALVLVSRANDESELPEIQNVIEAGGQMAATPSRWTTDTRVGGTYSTNYGDSRSVRFGAASPVDLPAAVAIVERNYATRKFRDVGYSSGGHYSYETSDQGRAGLLSESESYGSVYSRSEGAERRSFENIDYTLSRQIAAKSDNYSTVTGLSQSESTLGESKNRHTVERDSNSVEAVRGKAYSSSEQGTSESHSTVVGDSESHTTVGGASRSYETFRGARYSESTSDSRVESRSSVAGKSSSTETFSGGRYNEQKVVGDSESVSEVTGMDMTRAHTAVARHTSITGASNNNSVTGVSNDNSVVGVALTNSVAGTTTDLRASANSNQIHVSGASVEISLYGAVLQLQKAITGLRTRNESPATADVANTGTAIELPVLKTIL